MKIDFRNLLVSNLIMVITIFVLLSIFDHNGDLLRNIVIVFVGFIVTTIYGFVRIRRKE